MRGVNAAALHDTTNAGTMDGGPPLAAEDWHTVCQAIFFGVEQAGCANLDIKFVEKNKEINIRTGMWSGRSCWSSTCRVLSFLCLKR